MVSHGKTSPATAKAKPSRSRKTASVASQPMHHQPEHHKTASPASVVVEAGSTSKSSLLHLEQGTGPLVHEIMQIVHAVQAAVPEPSSIVIVYREKRSNGSRSSSIFAALPFFELLPFSDLLPI
jgi:hypothetical protein